MNSLLDDLLLERSEVCSSVPGTRDGVVYRKDCAVMRIESTFGLHEMQTGPLGEKVLGKGRIVKLSDRKASMLNPDVHIPHSTGGVVLE